MGGLFSKPSVPQVVIPEVAEVEEEEDPIPEIPPAAEGDNISVEKKKLKKKRGDKANLMTGGLGLSQISSENLYAHTLGGYTKTGVAA